MLILVLIVSCRTNPKQEEQYPSPSKLYYLMCDVNNAHKDETLYKCLRLKFYNNKGELLSTTQTDASIYSKWALGWCKFNDTVLLNSHDVGTLAYRISADRSLQKIDVTAKLQISADSIFNKKYTSSR